MTSEQFDRLTIEAYDGAILGSGPEGMKKADAIDEATEIVRAAIEAGGVEMPDVRAAVEKVVGATESTRRRSTLEDITYAVDALNADTILGADDPILKQSRPIGDGVRKALAYCGLEDLDEMVSLRRRHVADAVAAFDKFAAVIDDLKRAMRAANVAIVLDLYQGRSS